jgi:hypothetical protein
LKSLYFKIFSASSLITVLSPGIAASINMHVPCLWSRIMMSALSLGLVLSVHHFWFHNIVNVTSWLVLTDFDTWSYQCLLSNFTLLLLLLLLLSSSSWCRAFMIIYLQQTMFLEYLVMQLFFSLFLPLSKSFFVLTLYFLLYFGFGLLNCEWMICFELPQFSNFPEC